MRRRAFGGTGAALVLPALLLLAVLTLYPVAYGIWISLFSKHSFFPEQSFVGLANYLAIALDEEFWRSLRLGLVWRPVQAPFERERSAAARSSPGRRLRGVCGDDR